MTEIVNKRFGEERALYNSRGLVLRGCRFEGEEDGESALKESQDIELYDCHMALRYPFWHDKNITLCNAFMSETCRAALWYSDGIVIKNSTLCGVKALRECKYIELTNTQVNSPEFGWNSSEINAIGVKIQGEYAFLGARGVVLRESEFGGKYSFQYAKDVLIENCTLNTKDAFWHAENVVVKNCVVNGEYLGWYSEGLTLENCRITGTQPFCYCRGLKLINCTTERCDLSFEYSEVEADIAGDIESVKNPLSGRIVADSIGEIITDSAVYECKAEIICRK